MTVLTEHGQTSAKKNNRLLPEAIPENFRFISCDYNRVQRDYHGIVTTV